MALMTGGKLVIESVKAHGVDTIFGVISGQTMEIYDALYGEQDTIRFIGGRHEHAVGFMADGYSRATGKPGVFLTSGGPGAADSMGAMGEAYFSSSPVFQITANSASGTIESGKGAVHETKDQLGMFRSVTDWNARIDNLESLPDYFLQAFQQLRSGRPRPVELEIPADLLSQKVDAEILPSRELEIPQPNSSQIEQAAQALLEAKRPLIWAGSGVISANATPELRRLAETLNAPVVTYRTSKGAFPDDHSLSLGVGEFGDDKSPLEDFLRRCDLVLLVGCSMGYSRIRRTGLKLPSNLVQIDIDPKAIGRNYAASLSIVGDAKLTLQQLYLLAAEEGGGSDATYATDVAQCKKDVRQSLASHFPNEMKTLEGIRGILARDAIVVGDPTVPFARAMRCLPMYEPRTCIGPWGWDGLGFGFPAGLGAKVGRPDRQVVVITGDGGFQYNLQELGTAIQYGINPVVLIFNDNAWGVLKGYQHDKFDERYFATDLMNPDFVKLAEAYGAGISKVHSRSELLKSLGDALESKVVHLILVEMPQGFARFT